MWSDKKVKSQNKHDKNSTRELHEDTKKRKKWLLLLLLLLLLIGGSTGLAVYFINRSHDKYIRIKTDINSIIIDDIDSTIINGNFDTNIEKVETLEFCGKDAAKFNSLNFNLLSKIFSAKLDNTTPIGEYQLQLQVNGNANFMSNSVNIKLLEPVRTFNISSLDSTMEINVAKTLNINWDASYFTPVTIELDTTDGDTNNFDLSGGASPIPGTPLILSRKNVNLATGTYNVKFKAIDVDGKTLNNSININVINVLIFSVSCVDSTMKINVAKTLNIDWSSPGNNVTKIELDTTDGDTNNFDLSGGASPIPGTPLILSRKNVNLATGTYNVKFKATDAYNRSIIDFILINITPELMLEFSPLINQVFVGSDMNIYGSLTSTNFTFNKSTLEILIDGVVTAGWSIGELTGQGIFKISAPVFNTDITYHISIKDTSFNITSSVFDFIVLPKVSVASNQYLAKHVDGTQTTGNITNTTLNLSSTNPKIRELYVNSTTLQELNCDNQDLVILDILSVPNLRNVYISNNTNLTSLDFTKNTELRNVYINDNSNLKNIDITLSTKIQYLNINNGNQLKYLELASTNTNFQEVWVKNTSISFLDFSNLPTLEEIYASGCSQLNKIKLSASHNSSRIHFNYDVSEPWPINNGIIDKNGLVASLLASVPSGWSIIN